MLEHQTQFGESVPSDGMSLIPIEPRVSAARRPQASGEVIGRHRIEAATASMKAAIDLPAFPVPGSELHPLLYRLVGACFIWLLIVSWLAFGGSAEINFALAIVTLIFLIVAGLLTLTSWNARLFCHGNQLRFNDFIVGNIEICTGRMSAMEAWSQILIVPLALAGAATLMGIAYVIVAPASH